MSTYIIGDVQGCLAPLERLLARCGYDPSDDILWFCGDLVNRGPDSLACLRFIRSLGESAVCVLGNHDLALLCFACGAQTPTTSDTVTPILEADDADELIDWLRHRPFLHHDAHHNHTLVHAGIWPHWTLKQAMGYAGELESALRGPDWRVFLQHLYGDTPHQWSETLTGWDRLRFMVNAFTRMRFCTPDGALSLTQKGAESVDLVPWFAMPNRQVDTTICFGHWAALRGQVNVERVIALDTGCIWGGALTAYCLDNGQRLQVDCSEITCARKEASWHD